MCPAYYPQNESLPHRNSTAGGYCLQPSQSICAIGSIYAWSIYNPALIRTLGIVTSAPDDWSLRQVVWVSTAAIITAGLAAAAAGRWLEILGPRKIGLIAASCWGGGYLVGGAGILTHQLWLLYLG